MTVNMTPEAAAAEAHREGDRDLRNSHGIHTELIDSTL